MIQRKTTIRRNKAPNRIGDVFGNLTIIADAKPYRLNNAKRFVVECVCGRFTEIFQAHLRLGQTSCGCTSRERKSRALVTHGLSRTWIYRIWQGIVDRCYRPANPQYSFYGGRGIRVADEWREDVAAFASYMGDRPSAHHSVDRIDNDGNYAPGNVRWATPTEQNRNKSDSWYLTVNGFTKPLMEWCEERKISHYLVRSRVSAGWQHERALEPPKPRKDFAGEYVRIDDEIRTAGQWCHHFGVSLKAAHARVSCHGWDFTEAVSRPVGSPRQPCDGHVYTIVEVLPHKK